MSPFRRPIVCRTVRRAAAGAGVALVVAGVVGGALPAHPASATVVRALGYQATVDGWTSWYGSYGMGSLGPAWCIDHGIPAPDPNYLYGPSVVADHAAVTTRAMAWALGAYGPGADRPTAAALTLVLHDLAGAVYPLGRIDLDRLTAGRLAGFGGDGAQVLARARLIKRDAVAHAGLVPPLRITGARVAGQAAVVLAVTDGSGQPVPGAAVAADGAGPGGRTDDSGRVRLTAGGGVVGVTATVPDLNLNAFAPTRTVAQRVARPAVVRLHVTLAAVAPATTTTTARPATTTTTARPAVVRAAAAAPPPPAPPTPVAVGVVPAPAPPQLPFTGAPARPLALIGVGLALIGGAAVLGSRPAQPRQSWFEET